MDNIIDRIILSINNELVKINKDLLTNTELNDLCTGIVKSIEKLNLPSYHVASALYDGKERINVVKTFMYNDNQYRFNYQINKIVLIKGSR